jgi:FdhD protein
MSCAFREVPIVRMRSGRPTAEVDIAAAEEPLEIRLHREPFAVVMRTPGTDRELVAGFLLSERVIASLDDLASIAPMGRRGPNVVNVTLAKRRARDLDRLIGSRRNVVANAACGLCGRLTIESLRADVPPIVSRWTLPPRSVYELPAQLRSRQQVFAATGGLHAAALFERDGTLRVVAEDVGRHNAVDKVVGRLLLLDRLPIGEYGLVVSGRTSFEIVQKAYFAGIPIVAAISAPSSLAIELAQDAGICLIGFVRGSDFNVYTHPDRLAGAIRPSAAAHAPATSRMTSRPRPPTGRTRVKLRKKGSPPCQMPAKD